MQTVPICALLCFAGCSSWRAPGPKSAAAPAPIQAQETAEQAAIATILTNVKANRRADYKLSPSDLVQITVYREEDLSRTLRISQQGTISFPLVGDLQIGGRSVAEAAALLAAKLGDFLVNPQVTVFIKEYGNKQVYVLGEVTKPGSYTLPTESRLTVLEAVSLAGGFTPVAAKDRTRIIRTAENGGNQTMTVDVTAVTTKGEKDKDLPLEPNDVVFVPQSFF